MAKFDLDTFVAQCKRRLTKLEKAQEEVGTLIEQLTQALEMVRGIPAEINDVYDQLQETRRDLEDRIAALEGPGA